MVLVDPATAAQFALLRHEYEGPPDELEEVQPPPLSIVDPLGPGQHLMYCPECYMTARGSILRQCPNHTGEAPVSMQWGDEDQLEFYKSMQSIVAPDSDRITPPPDDR